MTLPTRQRSSFPHHQSLPSDSLHKSLFIASSTRGQTEEARRTTIPQPPERKPQLPKLNQNEQAERVICQVKEKDKTPEKQLKEVEIGNLPEKEFKIMMVKMIQDLRKRMEKMLEMFTKDLEELKNKQR